MKGLTGAKKGVDETLKGGKKPTSEKQFLPLDGAERGGGGQEKEESQNLGKRPNAENQGGTFPAPLSRGQAGMFKGSGGAARARRDGPQRGRGNRLDAW